MLTRRQFLRLCATAAGSALLADTLWEAFSEPLSVLAAARPPVIYLETTTCAGDIFSLLNTVHPDLWKLMFEVIDLRAQYSVMSAEGRDALEAVFRAADEQAGEFILVVEGTPQTRAGNRYGRVGEAFGRRWTAVDAVRELARKAKYIVANGTCAAYGGPYAARPNPTGAVPVSDIVDRPVIKVPGCPSHPDWIVGTLVHLLLYGPPSLDRFGRPLMFFRKTVHDLCERRTAFENGHFARRLGDDGCLYRLGCKGPVSFCDIPRRRWVEHLNWYIESGSPCIGCTEPGFPDQMEPFYAHLPDVGTPAVHATAQTAAYLATGLTAGAIAGHLGVSLLKGRVQRAFRIYRHREEEAEQADLPSGLVEGPSGLAQPSGATQPSGPAGTPEQSRNSGLLLNSQDRRRAIEKALERAYDRGRRRR